MVLKREDIKKRGGGGDARPPRKYNNVIYGMRHAVLRADILIPIWRLVTQNDKALKTTRKYVSIQCSRKSERILVV